MRTLRSGIPYWAPVWLAALMFLVAPARMEAQLSLPFIPQLVFDPKNWAESLVQISNLREQVQTASSQYEMLREQTRGLSNFELRSLASTYLGIQNSARSFGLASGDALRTFEEAYPAGGVWFGQNVRRARTVESMRSVAVNALKYTDQAAVSLNGSRSAWEAAVQAAEDAETDKQLQQAQAQLQAQDAATSQRIEDLQVAQTRILAEQMAVQADEARRQETAAAILNQRQRALADSLAMVRRIRDMARDSSRIDLGITKRHMTPQ